MPDYNEIMFATGDLAIWAIMAKDEFSGNHYNRSERTILSSSKKTIPYNIQVPRIGDEELFYVMIGLRHHSECEQGGCMLYV